MHSRKPLDHLVFSNGWRSRSPLEKLVFAGGLLLSTTSIPAWPWALAIFAISSAAAWWSAAIPLRAWARFLAPQLAFVSFAAFPLLFTLTPMQWTEAGAERAAAVWLRGLAAASSLTLLSLTTPVPDLLLVARQAKAPPLLVESAFLIYRLLTSLYDLLERLTTGLHLRLCGTKLRLPAASLSAGNLLVRGFTLARRIERGAAVRGLEGYHLLPPQTRTSARFLAGALAIELVLWISAVLLRSRFPW